MPQRGTLCCLFLCHTLLASLFPLEMQGAFVAESPFSMMHVLIFLLLFASSGEANVLQESKFYFRVWKTFFELAQSLFTRLPSEVELVLVQCSYLKKTLCVVFSDFDGACHFRMF